MKYWSSYPSLTFRVYKSWMSIYDLICRNLLMEKMNQYAPLSSFNIFMANENTKELISKKKYYTFTIICSQKLILYWTEGSHRLQIKLKHGYNKIWICCLCLVLIGYDPQILYGYGRNIDIFTYKIEVSETIGYGYVAGIITSLSLCKYPRVEAFSWLANWIHCSHKNFS